MQKESVFKMSIVFTKFEKPKAGCLLYRDYVRVSIDPLTKNQLNLPDNYKYHTVTFQQKYKDWYERMQNFEIRSDDIWIVGFPKTGTTWIHNIVLRLANNLNLSVPSIKSSENMLELPLFGEIQDANEHLLEFMNECEKAFDEYKNMPSPRVLRTHFPAFLMPQHFWKIKPKTIYIARNPKDAIVSYYYMMRNDFAQYRGSIELMCKSFIENELPFTPFFDHILSYWQLRHFDNVLFLTYENLTADVFGGVKKISEFLGYSYNDQQLTSLTEYVSFDNLKKQNLENVPADIRGGRKQDPNYR